MSMRTEEVRDALNAGQRQFQLDTGVTAEVLAHGSTWVKYRTPQMRGPFLSLSIILFAASVTDNVTEKSPDSASGQ
ncbi:hypothetical protein NST07_20650 [Paenibacillus sp. FSL L8-0340]|uniref:hypothetical protein n=1 Tax=Paenibacillus sp. FSL L8-0340 TaxID=2954685 RepID=UPI0031598929